MPPPAATITGMATTYLTINDVARMIGVQPATLRKYRSDNRLPKADIQIAQSPAWKPATIEKWIASRPGQGVGGGRKPAAKGKTKGTTKARKVA